jgi:hypothetical protein
MEMSEKFEKEHFGEELEMGFRLVNIEKIFCICYTLSQRQ